MAESVDASVSNTDRETCAGSTPARSTKKRSTIYGLWSASFVVSVSNSIRTVRFILSSCLEGFALLLRIPQKKGAHLTNRCVGAFPLWV